MSKQASTTIIGVFVLGAIVLGIATVVFFGSFNFGETGDFIVYFDEPVSGLGIGSPVKFRGVPIGKVVSIFIRYNQGEETDHIPVVIELDLTLLNSSLGVDVDIRDEETFIQIVNLGYRAQLVTESLITGLKYIEIDIEGDAGRPTFIQEKVIYKEFPTRPSLTAALGQTVEEVLFRLGSIDIQGINDELIGVLSRAREGLEEVDFAGINASIIRATDSVTELLGSEKIQKAIDTFDDTLEEYRKLAVKINSKVDPVLAEAEATNEELQTTLRQVADATEQIEFILSSESSFRYEMETALGELKEAAEAIRLLVEYIERNPRSLLTGRKLPESEAQK